VGPKNPRRQRISTKEKGKKRRGGRVLAPFEKRGEKGGDLEKEEKIPESLAA